MVKTPRTRHSKSAKQPLTIDLEAEKTAAAENPDAEAPGADTPDTDTGVPEDASAQDHADHAAREDVEETGTPGDEADKAAVTGKPVPAKQRSSAMALVAAGIIGGILAIGGNAVLVKSGILPDGSDADSAGLAALREDIASLKGQVQSGADTARAAAEASTAAIAEANDRIAAISGDVDALKGGLENLRSAIEAGGGGDNAALQVLTERLDAFDAKLASLAEGAGNGVVDNAKLAVIRTEIEAVRKLASEAADKASAATETAQGNIAFIDALKLDIDALAQRLEQQGSNPKIALAIAAAALKSAIDRGLPFMTELETYAAIAPGAPEIEALRELAASGVPTRTAIAGGMAGAAAAMIAAESTVDADAGFFERLFASAQSMIKVRPIGMVEGDTPGAIVARMEVAVNQNDYARALAEFDTLPDGAKAAGSAFAAKIRARMEADELIDRALASALKPANG